jgi:hypothetical protein
MTGIPSSFTPSPDPVCLPEEDTLAAAPDGSCPGPAPSTSSTDDLSLLLCQSIPDPFLASAPTPAASREETGASGAPVGTPRGGATLGKSSCETGGPGDSPRSDPQSTLAGSAAITGATLPDIALPIRLSSEENPQPDLSTCAGPSADENAPAGEERPRAVPWPLLLTASYASAVTLALFWVLWTGRSLRGPESSGEPGPAADLSGPLESPRRASPSNFPPLPARNLAVLGQSIRLGEIELTARRVAYRPVELVRLGGSSEDRRDSEPVLVLSLELSNRSRNESLTPLDVHLVRDADPGPDQPCLELKDGLVIPPYRLATESEWSIAGQDFPTLRPGESAETLVVTERLRLGDLSDPLLWRVKLRTGTFQTDVLGVRFSSRDIETDRSGNDASRSDPE